MIKTTRLDNGITLVYEALDFVKSVSFGIWIKNGSIDENESNNGISHFIEHMMFKGSKKRNAKEIAEEMASIGGRINAFTAKEYTCYYAHTLDEHLEVAIDVLSDMLMNPALKEEEINKEKGVILEEIAMSEDSPEDIVHDQLENQVFSPSTLSLDILGTRDNVKQFNREQLINYIDRHYVAENMVIAVAGAVDEAELIELLEEAFRNVSRVEPKPRQLDKDRNQTFIFKEKDIEQVHMVINFPAISYMSDQTFVLSILNTIIGGGINSKLFLGIREDKGLTYSIYTYVESYEATGMFNIYAAFNPAQAEEVIENTFKELDTFLVKGITEEELNRIKAQMKSNLIIGYENMNNRMSNYGKSKLMLGKVKTQEEIVEGIDDVTVEAVMAMAESMFYDQSLSLSLVGNLESVNIERVKALCKR